MTETKEATVTIRLSAADHQALRAIATANDESVSQTVRRAIRAFLAVTAALVAVLTLSACGAEDAPETQPAPVATTGAVAPPQPVAVQTSAPAATSEWCWKAGGPEDLAWMERYNEVTESYTAALMLLEELPDSSTACDEASREVLDARQEEEERVAEYLAND